MNAKEVSSAFTTNKIEETKEFYIKILGATITFDCGWYLNLEFGHNASTLQFMTPQQPEHKLASGDGLIYNFNVIDVENEYKRIKGQNIFIILDIEDHPWGDRGFCIQDPNGISIYIYSEREPSEEFKKYYKNL